MSNEPETQRWTAKRKAELVKEIIKSKTNIAEAARTHDKVEYWVDDAMQGMGNALKANPKDITELYEKKLEKMHAAYGEAMLQIRFLKKLRNHLDQAED